MSRLPTDLPERLLAADATDFERQVIEAALQKQPSPAASARMAKALGIAVTGVATTFPSKAAAGDAATSKATAGAAASTVWPWVSLGVLALVFGATVGARAWHASHLRPTPTAPTLIAPPPPPDSPRAAIRPAGEVAEPAPSPTVAIPRSHVATARGGLRDEIAYVDAAQTAMLSGDDRRALEILGRYRDKYPSGSFRPEATAIRIEALMKLSRQDEAKALATRFVAENRGSLLARRVAELVGLTESSTAP
jgi:hypothetical protein